MSDRLVHLARKSLLPKSLSYGVLGALCARANDDGILPVTPTVQGVNGLVAHVGYPDRSDGRKRTLGERALRYQVLFLKRLSILTISPAGWRIHALAIETLTREKLVMVRQSYRQGAKVHAGEGALLPVENRTRGALFPVDAQAIVHPESDRVGCTIAERGGAQFASYQFKSYVLRRKNLGADAPNSAPQGTKEPETETKTTETGAKAKLTDEARLAHLAAGWAMVKATLRDHRRHAAEARHAAHA